MSKVDKPLKLITGLWERFRSSGNASSPTSEKYFKGRIRIDEPITLEAGDEVFVLRNNANRGRDQPAYFLKVKKGTALTEESSNSTE